MTEVIWKLTSATLLSSGTKRLDSVTVEIRTGVTAVIGYSGAGKTSLLNILAQMEAPSSGLISRSLPGNTRALPLYWVPQDGGLWPHWSVRKHLNAVLPPQNRGHSEDFVDKQLNQFDLMHRQHAFPDSLSMGERSRLSVARALSASPRVLIMDEPLAHVDPVRRPAYWTVIRDYLQQNETSLVYSTHEPETAISESERVICLSGGRVLYSGSTDELYRNAPSEEVGQFLGPINWFDPQGASVWLETEKSPRLAFRPEMIRLIPDAQADIRILSIRFHGSYAETVLEHTTHAARRTIVHRPVAGVHQAGQCVRIETVS